VTRRILHASDFSPASAPAFARAVALAKAKHAELCLLHVLDPTMPVADGVVSPPTYAALLKSARAYARKGLARLVARGRGRRPRDPGPAGGFGVVRDRACVPGAGGNLV